MNFVDAAVAILSGDPGKPVHVEELCRLALEQDLLSKPGKAPLRSMKARLTTELKKGDDSRVVKLDGDMWQLAGEVAEAVEAGAEAAAESPAVPDPGLPEPQGNLEDLIAPEARKQRPGEVEVPAAEAAEELYADETDEEDDEPALSFTEYEDEQTADEDRPMLPEISARKERFQKMRDKRRDDRDQRRRRRRRRGERGERKEGGDSGNGEARSADRGDRSERSERNDRSERAERAAERAAEVVAGAPRYLSPGTAWGDGAVEALSSIKGGQSTQIKQLAQMMRKRKQLDGDAEQVWPLLKAALLRHEREREAAGLAPEIEYRGRDLFAEAPPLEGPTAATEVALGKALVAHRLAVRAALADKLRAVGLNGLEQLVQIYLLDIGWTEIEWLKRVGESSYCVGQPLALPGKVLVGVRAGNGPVDRRGVGELRAGVAAKGLREGLLLSPHPLGDEALAELEKSGSAVHVICGDAFVDALLRSDIGVKRQTVPVVQLDQPLFRELARG